MNQVLFLCLLFPRIVSGLVSQEVASPWLELHASSWWEGEQAAQEPSEQSDLGGIEEKTDRSEESPKEVVQEYLEDLKEHDTNGVMDLLGDAAKMVTHTFLGTKVTKHDQLEKHFQKHPLTSKNYDEQVEKVDEPDGNQVAVHSRVKTPIGWVKIKSIFTVDDDNKIESVDVRPERTPKAPRV